MITGNVQIENTISALRGGAYDFIGKPLNLEELRVTIRNAIEARHLRREVAQVRKERAGEFNFRQIVGESPVMKDAWTRCEGRRKRSVIGFTSGGIRNRKGPDCESDSLRIAPCRTPVHGGGYR